MLSTRARNIIPPLSKSMHKGQCGRVAVMGGSFQYTGAPYYAAISSLKAGADLAFVFCDQEAALPIKAYSPELIVYPMLQSAIVGETMEEFEDRATAAAANIEQILPRIHVLVIGPGLGRDPLVRATTVKVIEAAKKIDLPIVVDADALYFLSLDTTPIVGYKKAILTPNLVEFKRLYETVFDGKSPATPQYNEMKEAKSKNGWILSDERAMEEACTELALKLGNVTIVQKGRYDVISNGLETCVAGFSGSPRRCGGQGDILAGTLGLFNAWANFKSKQGHPMDTLAGAYGASVLTRQSSLLAFNEHKRATTTPDIIQKIGIAFEDVFGA